MGLPEYERYDALGLAALVRKREVTPAELLDEAVRRMEARNPRINAVVISMVEQARDEVARGVPDGPFTGVPYLLKDYGLRTRGTVTTTGARLFRDYAANYDDEFVTRMRRAGLVLFGKTAAPEFIAPTSQSALFGDTRNPWSLELSPGGSSGGATAAVAAGIVPAAQASDGGGSIRIPASCCGLFGLKPTRGRIPFAPTQGEGWSGMSTLHAVTRTVRDSAALLDATHGPALGDPYAAPAPARPFLDEVGAPPGRLRVALQREPFAGGEVHPDCAAAVEAAARLLEELGHRVEETRLEVPRPLVRATSTLIGANVLATLEDRARELGRELGPDDVETLTEFFLGLGRRAGAADYARALRMVHASGRQVAQLFERCDVLLTPTMCIPPPPLDLVRPYGDDLNAILATITKMTAFTSLFNAAGTPATSLPLYWNAAGVPIGVQIAARYGDEAALFRLAAQLEEARPWLDRRPPELS
jgi:Asp-tRNA(Asn)/Glu-tRNA(Gln) amidotransferase A subunit family amidase